MLITLLSFIFLITIPVFLHELGHYIAARSVGIKVEKFYVGFNLFGLGYKKKYKGTEYGIGLFPLGGYVKVAGILDESLDKESVNTSKPEEEFRTKNTFQKLWFLSAGVIMNFILSIIIFSALFYFRGIPESTGSTIIATVHEKLIVLDDSKNMKEVNSPIYEAGLRNNDTIIEIDGNKINSWEDIGKNIKHNNNKTLNVKWLSSHSKIVSEADVFIYGVPTRSGMHIKEVGMLGISSESKITSLTFFESIQSGIYATYKVIEEVAYMFAGFITGNIPLKYTAGLIGMANMAGEVAQQSNGFINLLGLMALISTNLGFINILPIPGLDGGHAAIAIVEGVKGKELSQKTKMRIQLIGLGLIIMLFTYTIFNDIRNISNF